MSIRCARCKIEKPVAEMQKDRRKPGGIDTRCKACMAVDRRARYAADPAVLEKQRARRRANPEEAKARARERSRRWRAANAERAREAVRMYAAAHREEARERMRAWQLANPEAVREHSRLRHQRLKAALVNDLTEPQWQAILSEHGHRCAYCGRSDVKLGQDHVTPLARGGAHSAANVVPACFPCNQRKALNDAPLPPPSVWTRARAERG